MRMNPVLFACLLFALRLSGWAETKDVDIVTLGANPDGKTLCTEAFFNYTGTGTEEDANAAVPKKENAYLENRMFGHGLPAYGLCVRHVKHLSVQIQTTIAHA